MKARKAKIAFLAAALCMQANLTLSKDVKAPEEKTGGEAAQETAGPAQLKNILLDLIRYDSHLANIGDMIEDSRGSLNLEQINTVRETVRITSKNIVSSLEKTQKTFFDLKPGATSARYGTLILSNARNLNAKLANLRNAVAEMMSENTGSFFRDAPSSAKTKAGGKDLAVIIKEHKALESLFKDLKKTVKNSEKLKATAKWLVIVSR